MVWSIVSKDDMSGSKTPPVFGYYRDAIGGEGCRLAVVEEDDPLEFVGKDDTVLLRTVSSPLIDAIRRRGALTTAEDFGKYRLAGDKVMAGEFLRSQGIPSPDVFGLREIKDGEMYFVKPRFGSDSVGVTSESVCRTADDVAKVCGRLSGAGLEPVVQRFLDGEEYTVACLDASGLRTFPAGVSCEATGGVQTYAGKYGYSETHSPVGGDTARSLNEMAASVFRAMGIRHHARIDFRSDGRGNMYVIDVNLIPGLGPDGDLAGCLRVAGGVSYADAIRMVVDTASR